MVVGQLLVMFSLPTACIRPADQRLSGMWSTNGCHTIFLVSMLQALGSALNCHSSIKLPVPGLLLNAEQAQEAYRQIRSHRNKRAVQTMKALVINGKIHGISRGI